MADIKSVNGIAKASLKSINGLAKASIKTVNTLGTLYSPTDDSNIKCWLAGSEYSGGAGAVTTIADETGNGNSFGQSNATYKPNYNTTNETFEFDADYMTASGISAKAGIFVVRNIDGNYTLNWATHILGLNGTLSSYIFLNDGDDTATYTISVDGVGVDTGKAGVNGETPNPSDGTGTNITCTGHTNFPKRNEVDFIYWEINTSRSWSALGIADNSVGNASIFDLHDLILFQNTPSTSERQKAEGYFAHKHSITSKLPSGHPYKSSAP